MTYISYIFQVRAGVRVAWAGEGVAQSRQGRRGRTGVCVCVSLHAQPAQLRSRAACVLGCRSRCYPATCCHPQRTLGLGTGVECNMAIIHPHPHPAAFLV